MLRSAIRSLDCLAAVFKDAEFVAQAKIYGATAVLFRRKFRGNANASIGKVALNVDVR